MTQISADVDIPIARAFVDFCQPARFKGAYGGRGSGKSWYWAGEVVEALLEGLDVLCIREVQNSIADSVKRLIESRIEEYGVSDYFDITEKEIRCPAAGSVAIFRGMQNHTAASVKSLEGFDRAWWEEAQTASQRSLDLLIPTIRRPGSELWFSWNPENEDDPIDVLLRASPPDGAIVKKVNWNDNPWFPAELKADLERDKRRDPDKFAHVWNGEYKGLSESRVFRNWREGEMEPPDDVVWFYGADWGFANDETAGLRVCFPSEDVAYIDAEVFELGVPMEGLPSLFNGLPEATKWPMRADSARPETIDYMRRHGFPYMRGAKKGKGSIQDGIMFLQSFDVVINPRCVNTLREFSRYAYKTDKQTGQILPVVEDKNNHLIDSLRYAVERLHRKGKMLPPKELEKQSGSTDYGIDEDEGDEDSWLVA